MKSKKWMDVTHIILASLAVLAAAGATTAYFARGRGTETIKLLQANIDAYKDSEKLKDARIVYLEGQIVGLNETVKNLNKVIKDAKR